MKSRKLDSVQRCTYRAVSDVEAQHTSEGQSRDFDAFERDLDRVFRKFPLIRREREEAATARRQLCIAVEEFRERKLRTERAKSVSRDLRDLRRLEELFRDAVESGSWVTASNFVLSLHARNPVLRQRLTWAFRQGGLGNPRTLEGLRDPERVLARLQSDLAEENNRGRPTDWAARWFAHRIYDLWKRFTGRGTSTKSRSWDEMGPFVAFLQAAGKLVDPGFNGPHYARAAHEERRKR